MAKYWIVGASWDGEPQDRRFVEEGIWILGWEKGPQKELASKIQSGARIAIKRRKGKGQTGIRILHLGIVKGVNLDPKQPRPSSMSLFRFVAIQLTVQTTQFVSRLTPLTIPR